MTFVSPLLFILALLIGWAVIEIRRLVSVARRSSTPTPELLRDVIWEIRTSMNSILGFAEVLSSTPFDSVGEKDRQEIVATVKRHCDRILVLMNGLLDDEVAVSEDDLPPPIDNSAEVEPETSMSLSSGHIFGDRLKAILEQLISTQQAVQEPPDKPLAEYRILLVEDIEVNRLLTAFQLRDLGAHVDIAENGQVGIDVIRREERENRFYDLVVMDMQMPVMDGYAATRSLRASGFLRPILALTANALPGDREKTIDAGCNDYLPRPAAPSDLLESIQTLLFTFHEEPELKS